MFKKINNNRQPEAWLNYNYKKLLIRVNFEAQSNMHRVTKGQKI